MVNLELKDKQLNKLVLEDLDTIKKTFSKAVPKSTVALGGSFFYKEPIYFNTQGTITFFSDYDIFILSNNPFEYFKVKHNAKNLKEQLHNKNLSVVFTWRFLEKHKLQRRLREGLVLYGKKLSKYKNSYREIDSLYEITNLYNNLCRYQKRKKYPFPDEIEFFIANIIIKSANEYLLTKEKNIFDSYKVLKEIKKDKNINNKIKKYLDTAVKIKKERLRNTKLDWEKGRTALNYFTHKITKGDINNLFRIQNTYKFIFASRIRFEHWRKGKLKLFPILTFKRDFIKLYNDINQDKQTTPMKKINNPFMIEK